MLEIKNISAGYGKNTVLKDVSAVFQKGSFTAVIGPNGSGKSTLLRSALGLIPLISGEISVDGRALNQLKRQDIAKKIALLPQGKNIPDMTVRQMVLHGRFPHLSYPRRYSREDYSIAEEAINKMGLAEYSDAPLAILSGGMRQNAYIAMSLAQDTDYILLDEPTTYLDIAHNLELMKMLCDLAKNGKGIIAVMHDLPISFTYSDNTVVMQDGRIVLSDKTKTVAEDDIIKQVFGVKVCNYPESGGYCYRLE